MKRLASACLALALTGGFPSPSTLAQAPAPVKAAATTPRYDFNALFDKGAADKEGDGIAWIQGGAEKETQDVLSPPSAIRLDCSKTKPEARGASVSFYLLKSKLEPFKGKPLLFRAQVKLLQGTGPITAHMRCSHVDEKGEWHHLLASRQATFKGSPGQWGALELRCMVPANEQANGIDFQIWVEKTPDPAVVLIDDPVVNVTADATDAFVSGFAAYAPEQGTAPLDLVKGGKPLAVIVTEEKPTPTVLYAVQELNEHLELCTGTKLAVVKDTDPVDGPALHVGATILTRRLGMTPELLPPDNWVVRRVGNAIVIAGGDNRNNLTPVGNTKAPFGTLYAAYEFLERALGVRWYWPGELGRVTPKRPTLSLGTVQWQGAPSYETRFCWYANHKDPEITGAMTWAWWRRMRWGGVGGDPIGMHSFNSWNKKYGAEHPDWFALQRNGQRLNNPDGSGNELGHLCYTHPDVLAAVTKEKQELFDKTPWSRYSPVMTGDSDDLYWCQCDRCKPLIRPQDGREGAHSLGMWTFVNQVAAELRKTHPDRYITCCAYASYRKDPKDVFLEPNVAVTLCAGHFPNQLWQPDVKDRYVGWIQKWSAKSANLYVWDYWNSPRYGKGVYGAPAIFPHAIQEWFLLERGRVKGHAIEWSDIDHNGESIGGWADWMFDAVNAYTAMRLLWDLDQNVDAMLDEFYTQFYGPAGPGVKRFHDAMEAAYANPNGKGGPEFAWDWNTCWVNTYPQDFVADVMGSLRDAVKAAEGQEPYHARAERTLKGFLPFENASRRYGAAATNAVTNVEVRLPTAPTPPAIDGNLDDTCWQTAVVAGGFVDSFNSAELRAKTEMRLARDDKSLFIAIRAELPDDRAKTTLPPDSVDRYVWENESCEMFLVQGVKKYQFLIGPGNIYADNYHPDLNQKFAMDMFQWTCAGVQYKAVSTGKEWTAELAVPLASMELAPPTKDAPWRVNFCRNFFYSLDPPDTKAPHWQTELSTWRPTFGSFHNVDRFGTLWFE
ncbi:MAG: hypothetical protein A3K19_04335 [Lentisphaerae bacterium RIFOXYB12_FULL_65_16]|nr:MAG: hypothetical protein A3K18_34805 [Lentisphaerae bacterium RIFOXYA12_64_32]OGV84549.1 MAG: hypothetical protein A3K19_04335 [Lentisphaerae bacterium RIFOXYB12_FULL_65_16]